MANANTIRLDRSTGYSQSQTPDVQIRSFHVAAASYTDYTSQEHCKDAILYRSAHKRLQPSSGTQKQSAPLHPTNAVVHLVVTVEAHAGLPPAAGGAHPGSRVFAVCENG